MASAVKVKGIDETLKALDRLDKSFSVEAIEAVCLKGAQIFRDEAYYNAPIGETRGLRRSIVAKTLRRIRAFAAAIFAVDFKKLSEAKRRSRYPYIVEYGSKPHAIKPKKAKSLSLFGGRVHAEKVNHPGFRERRFFRDAVSRKRNAVVALIHRELKRLADMNGRAV